MSSSEILALAESVAKKAGNFLERRPDSFELTEKSSAVDFATQMDQGAEKLIVEEILKVRPNDGIIAEEGSSRDSKSGITWVIDPLDGTTNYFYGLPGWNTSIAAKDENGYLVGAVCAPSINSFWSAERGKGATFNGKKIKCNEPVKLEKALIATGFTYDLQLRQSQGDLMSKLISKIRDVRRTGAAAVDLCYVAMGAVNAYFEATLKEWDFAAGGLIATEAGAKISGRHGKKPDSEMVICAGPTLHSELVKIID